MEFGQIIVLAFNAFILFAYVSHAIRKVNRLQATQLANSMYLKFNQVIRLFIHY